MLQTQDSDMILCMGRKNLCQVRALTCQALMPDGDELARGWDVRSLAPLLASYQAVVDVGALALSSTLIGHVTTAYQELEG